MLHINTREKTQSIPQNTRHSSLHTFQNRLQLQTRRRPPNIKNNISFSQLNTSNNTFPIELQIIIIHLSTSQQLHTVLQTCTFRPVITNKRSLIISSTFSTITNLPNAIISQQMLLTLTLTHC